MESSYWTGNDWGLLSMSLWLSTACVFCHLHAVCNLTGRLPWGIPPGLWPPHCLHDLSLDPSSPLGDPWFLGQLSGALSSQTIHSRDLNSVVSTCPHKCLGTESLATSGVHAPICTPGALQSTVYIPFLCLVTEASSSNMTPAYTSSASCHWSEWNEPAFL